MFCSWPVLISLQKTLSPNPKNPKPMCCSYVSLEGGAQTPLSCKLHCFRFILILKTRTHTWILWVRLNSWVSKQNCSIFWKPLLQQGSVLPLPPPEIALLHSRQNVHHTCQFSKFHSKWRWGPEQDKGISTSEGCHCFNNKAFLSFPHVDRWGDYFFVCPSRLPFLSGILWTSPSLRLQPALLWATWHLDINLPIASVHWLQSSLWMFFFFLSMHIPYSPRVTQAGHCCILFPIGEAILYPDDIISEHRLWNASHYESQPRQSDL